MNDQQWTKLITLDTFGHHKLVTICRKWSQVVTCSYIWLVQLVKNWLGWVHTIITYRN